MSKTAKVLKVFRPHERGDDGGDVVVKGRAGVVQLTPPLCGCEYMFVSESVVLGEPETYAFECNADEEVVDWCELPISRKGAHRWEQLLLDEGYSIDGVTM